MMGDFVAELTALARDAAGIDDTAAARLAAALRSSYGGQRVRILPVEPVSKERIDSELRRGKVVREIAREMGTSRATIYRHLKPKVARRLPRATG